MPDLRDASAHGLLEREQHVAVLDRLIEQAGDGGGRLAVIEGPAGIGKTRLLAEARARASGRMTVLSARCSELERDFSFGAVRQLFEAPARDPDRRARMLSGATAAGGVLEGLHSAGMTSEGSFAVLHALYWTTLNLAEEQPLLLSIDDLQWSDRPTLRFVAHLARRLEGSAVLVLATVRSSDPGTDPVLLAEICADPLCELLRPGPLGERSTAELIGRRLGDGVAPAFTGACHRSTGGNPLLLAQLLAALEADGVRPTAAGAAAVHEIGPRAVSRTIVARLARLPEAVTEVARAVAVLGESSRRAVVAAVTGLDELAVARATDTLARAEILQDDAPPRFVHPLVREAVYRDLVSSQRALRHDRAATVLEAEGAPAEEIAAQLLHAPPRGDPTAVEVLRAAADRAQRRGGPDSAVTYLERALAEPPPPASRGAVLLELGTLQVEMNVPAAGDHLAGALEVLTEPQERATAALWRAQTLLFGGRPDEAGALAARAAAELPEALLDARLALEAMQGIAVYFGGRDAGVLRRLEPYRAGCDGDGPGARMMAAAAAFAWSTAGGPPSDCEALALRALEAGDLLSSGKGVLWAAAVVTLILAGSSHAAPVIEAAREESYRGGTILSTGSVEMFAGAHLLGTGDLEQAGVALWHTLELHEAWGVHAIGDAWARALLGAQLAMCGDAAASRSALGVRPDAHDSSDGANLWRRTEAELLLAEGRAAEALELAELMGERAPYVVHPGWKPWLSLRARALAMLDRPAEALDAMTAELALARVCGGRALVGRCLRQLGELEGSSGIERLREAIELLAASPARLEHAQALAALGGVLRRSGSPGEARAPLREALDLATLCGCEPLAQHARTELYATGARPRTAALRGVASLTASELRVARFGAEGRTNREIAQALFVTPKTVELHLSSAYRKLDIRSRRELPRALAATA